MRVERGRDRAEVVGDRVERKRGRGRRGVGRNVSLGGSVSVLSFDLCFCFCFCGGLGGEGREGIKGAENDVCAVEADELVCIG